MVDFKYLDTLIDKANVAMGKVLTTKDRKKLKKTTFCGPNRSFPVPDCQHVATAKAYLNRSKFSKATKQKIAACINRKAKALGCSKGKPAKAKGDFDLFEDLTGYTYAKLSQPEKDLYRSEIFATTKELVEQSLKTPDMELFEEKEESPCENC